MIVPITTALLLHVEAWSDCSLLFWLDFALLTQEQSNKELCHGETCSPKLPGDLSGAVLFQWMSVTVGWEVSVTWAQPCSESLGKGGRRGLCATYMSSALFFYLEKLLGWPLGCQRLC